MSADLFAVFGTSEEAPAKQPRDERWMLPQKGPELHATPHVSRAVPCNTDVLFDADEAESEDDFGEFEDVPSTESRPAPALVEQKRVPAAPTMSSLTKQTDLLDLEEEPVLKAIEQHRRFLLLGATAESTTTGDADEWGDFEDFNNGSQPEPQSAMKTAIVPEHVNDRPTTKDDWDEFEEWNAEQSTTGIATEPTETANPPQKRMELPDEPRPSNIPPPTILLQLLPEVFQTIHDQAKTPKNLSEIDETAALIVVVFAVSARIIAGRALRWKRDTYLAQSSRIGPSSAGARSGGMKLTAVNRSEAIREEREAADVCDAWSRNTHVFAGVVTRSEHRRPWMNLNIKMTPRPSPGFGTLEAREACALCGIKRDERIAGVDFEADDVFTEYWTEHWGHTDCKMFWYTFREMLEQR